MAGFKEATALLKVALVLACLGFALQLVGFATPYWNQFDYSDPFVGSVRSNAGLWTSCGTTDIYGQAMEGCNRITDSASWFEATQAFETLGFIAALGALVLIVLYIFVPAFSGKRIVFILTMVACFVAAGCIILGIIIYGAKVKDNLSWSFALCTIAGIIFGVSGLLLIVDMLKNSRG